MGSLKINSLSVRADRIDEVRARNPIIDLYMTVTDNISAYQADQAQERAEVAKRQEKLKRILD